MESFLIWDPLLQLGQRKDSTPLGRLMVPDDLAQAFLFAASGNASMITGSMITVDGGAAL